MKLQSSAQKHGIFDPANKYFKLISWISIKLYTFADVIEKTGGKTCFFLAKKIVGTIIV